MNIECCWCHKSWTWDNDQDCFVEPEVKEIYFEPIGDLHVWLYLCTCGGSIAAYTSEPKGGNLLGTVDI